MAWRTIVLSDVQNRFTPAELSMLQAAQNSLTFLQNVITDLVNETVSAMQGAGYPVTAGQVPDSLRRHVISAVVWEWLRYFPALKAFKTPERQDGHKDFQRIFEKICARKFGSIEAPYGTDITTGNWNSENKLIMRTHPTPSPVQQFQPTAPNTPNYGNPNAPSDRVPTNSPGLPAMPLNLVADGQAGKIVLTWEPAQNAATYSLYRGPTSQGELATPLASGITGTNYTDPVTTGTTFYYKVQAVAGALASDLSTEVSGTAL